MPLFYGERVPVSQRAAYVSSSRRLYFEEERHISHYFIYAPSLFSLMMRMRECFSPYAFARALSPHSFR